MEIFKPYADMKQSKFMSKAITLKNFHRATTHIQYILLWMLLVKEKDPYFIVKSVRNRAHKYALQRAKVRKYTCAKYTEKYIY